MAEREYIRLTHAHNRSGVALFMAVRSSLWLGRDHLLCVDTNGYTETYKRFYFRDIQAISIRRTPYATVWTSMFGALAVVCAIAALRAPVPGMNIVFWVIAGMFLLLVGLNLLGGPSCVCQLRTAVQTEELPSLNRVRRAQKILKRIRPLIETAQGTLPPGSVSSAMRELAAPYIAAANAGVTPVNAPVAAAPPSGA